MTKKKKSAIEIFYDMFKPVGDWIKNEKANNDAYKSLKSLDSAIKVDMSVYEDYVNNKKDVGKQINFEKQVRDSAVDKLAELIYSYDVKAEGREGAEYSELKPTNLGRIKAKQMAEQILEKFMKENRVDTSYLFENRETIADTLISQYHNTQKGAVKQTWAQTVTKKIKKVASLDELKSSLVKDKVISKREALDIHKYNMEDYLPGIGLNYQRSF